MHHKVLAIITLLLTLARFCNELWRVCIIGAADHFAMEHWALAAGDALTWAIDFAGVAIQLVCITVSNMLPMTMVFVVVMESQHLLHFMHLMPEAMVLMIMMTTSLAEPRPIMTSLADTMKDRRTICQLILALACRDHWLEFLCVRKGEVSCNSSKAQDYCKSTHHQSDRLVQPR